MLLASASLAVAKTSFTADNGAQWNDPLNWTNGVPDASSLFFLPSDTFIFPFPIQAVVDGYAAEADEGIIGGYLGEAGKLWVQNDGSLTANALSIGDAGEGHLYIANGGKVYLANMESGNYGDGSGEVEVSGSGSLLSVQYGFVMAEEGSGSLTVKEGGRAAISSLYLSDSSGGTGSVTVSGAPGARGTLAFGKFEALEHGGGGSVAVDGGILEASRDEAEWIDFGSSPSVAIELGDGGGTIDTLGFHVGTAATFTGSGSLEKTGGGSLELSGASTYSGGTTVSEGTLRVSNTTGSALGDGEVQVLQGTTLGGDGILGGPTTIAGFLEPGEGVGSLGTLTFSGESPVDLTLTDTASVLMEIGSLSAFDQISVSGKAAFDGTLQIAFLDGYLPSDGDMFALFDMADGDGMFDSILFDDPDYSGSFDADTGILTVWMVPEPSSLALLGAAALLLLLRRSRVRLRASA